MRTRVAVEDQPAAAILREAAAACCDLVALATHGRHGLARLLLGSVADKIIRGAAVPVLVHRPLAPDDARADAPGAAAEARSPARGAHAPS